MNEYYDQEKERRGGHISGIEERAKNRNHQNRSDYTGPASWQVLQTHVKTAMSTAASANHWWTGLSKANLNKGQSVQDIQKNTQENDTEASEESEYY